MLSNDDRLEEYWNTVATKSVPDCHPILPLIASMLLGTSVLAQTSSVPAAVFAVGGGTYAAMKRAMKSAGQLDAIYDRQCHAISLSAPLLREYIKDYGFEHTKSQLELAKAEGLLLSEAAEEFLVHINTPTSVSPLVPGMPELEGGCGIVSLRPHNNLPIPTIETVTTGFTLPTPIPSKPKATIIPQTSDSSTQLVSKQPDNFLATLLPKIQNYCFIGLPRSGKDYLCSLLAEEAKRLFGVKFFVIDPKGDPDEAGLWEGIADRVYRFEGSDIDSARHAKHIRAAFAEFQAEVKASNKQHRWILVYNEFTTSSLELKAANDPFLAQQLPKLIAMGDSLKMNLWLIAQSPHMNAGLDGSVLGMFARLMIIQPENLGTFAGWQKTQLMTGVNLDRVDDVCRKSEMSRAVFCSAIEQRWLPMPRLKRKTRWYCRETEQWVGELASPHLGDEAVPQMSGNTTEANHLGTSVNHLGDNAMPKVPESLVVEPPRHLGSPIDAKPTVAPIPEQPSVIVAMAPPRHLGDAKLDIAVLNYFANATKKEPKQIRDIKAASSMNSFDEVSLLQSLERLVNNEQIESPMRGYWSLSDWT